VNLKDKLGLASAFLLLLIVLTSRINDFDYPAMNYIESGVIVDFSLSYAISTSAS